MKARTEKKAGPEEPAYLQGPSNPGKSGFVMLYHSDSIAHTYFGKMNAGTARNAAPVDVVHPYPEYSSPAAK